MSPFLVGDPVRLGPGVMDLTAIGEALGLRGLLAARVLPLGTGVALIHARLPGGGPLALRWVSLPGGAVLGPGVPAAETAVILTAPLQDSGRALRLVGRLHAVLGAAGVLERAREALTREALVQALAGGAGAGESALSGAEVLALLDTAPEGLSGDEAAARLALTGPNRLERVVRRPLWARFAEQFTGLFAILLWIGGFLAVLAGLPELGWAVFAVIAVNGVFAFLQEHRAERAVEALAELLPHEVTVRRDGRERRVPARELVPGDVVCLTEGDQVPADGQILDAAGLSVDQSALTGESHPVDKLPAIPNARARVPWLERHELLFAGTAVVVGQGTMVARATGMHTEIGAIARLTQGVSETDSPLKRELGRVTRLVTLLAVGFGVSFFALAVATRTLSVADGFLFAIGVIVANVPEGLLPTLTLALALGVQQMARQRSIVKRLSAVEALGAVTVICTDKTGTLTAGRMSARLAWAGGRGWRPDCEVASPPEVRDLLAAAALASQATGDRGDPTELALLEAARRAGLDPDALRGAQPLLAPYPFDSFRKRMTLVRADGGSVVAYVKGALEGTLACCARVGEPGKEEPLAAAARARIAAEHDRLAAEGLRVLAVARRVLDRALVGAPATAVEDDLTLLGLVALGDPPRREVPGAVALCRRAGIRVTIVTGDHGLTARAVARQIGVPVTSVVTGEELDRLGPEGLRALLVDPGVLFARVSPAHKMAIVAALRERGEVVAVTGDGVNDAPALKAADIGVAMGRRGTDVAREAAAMVIADDNFASIVTAVRLGRSVYANMGKFVTYIFASNVPELVPFLAFVFLGVPLPLTVMQILAVDLGTDLLPALALGAEPPEPDVMDRPPRPRQQRLLGAPRLLRAYGFLGVVEASLSLGAYFWTYWLAGWRPGRALAPAGPLYRRATTMTLGGIVASQVGNVFACRTDRESVLRAGLLGNRLVLIGIGAEVMLFVALVTLPPLAGIFGLERLRPAEWGVLLFFPGVVLGLEEVRKAVLRRRPSRRDTGRAA